MHLVKYSMKETSAFRWLTDYSDHNPAPTHVHSLIDGFTTGTVTHSALWFVALPGLMLTHVESERSFPLIYKMTSSSECILFTPLE